MAKDKIETYHLLKNEPRKRQFDLFDLAAYQKINAAHSSKPHSHSFYQLIWFKSNAGEHVVDFERYKIEENSIFFIAKNQVHFFEQRTDYQGYLIHFNESFLLSNETDINFFLTYTIFRNKKQPFFQIPEQLIPKIASFFTQIEDEIEYTDHFGNSTILSNLLKALLLVIEREMRKNSGDQIEADDNKYLLFRDLLENNFYRNWSVSDFADALTISTKTLNSLVKKATGTTVSQTISERIILEAKRKLTHSNAFINEIGFELGFNDPYYFTKYFKKHVNCSPAEFRKSIS